MEHVEKGYLCLPTLFAREEIVVWSSGQVVFLLFPYDLVRGVHRGGGAEVSSPLAADF